MKPAPFAYVDPRSVPEALDALARHGDEAKILAGGQSLVPLLNMRLSQPAVLIDLNRLPDLAYVRGRARGGVPGFAIGAMTRQRAVEDAPEVAGTLPLLAEALSWVGHPQIRNRGTVGGSVAHADPAAELPLVFRVLDGVATVCSTRGTREVPAAEFFVYTFSPDIAPDEALTEVWLPAPAPRTGQAFVEVARRHGDFALVAAAVSLTLDGAGRCADIRIALGGAAPVPVRAEQAEAVLRSQIPGENLFREAAALATAHTDPTGDVHADAAYRREVVGTLTLRGLMLALARAERQGNNS